MSILMPALAKASKNVEATPECEPHADPHYRDLDDVRAPPKLSAGTIRKMFFEGFFG